MMKFQQMTGGDDDDDDVVVDDDGKFTKNRQSKVKGETKVILIDLLYLGTLPVDRYYVASYLQGMCGQVSTIG